MTTQEINIHTPESTQLAVAGSGDDSQNINPTIDQLAATKTLPIHGYYYEKSSDVQDLKDPYADSTLRKYGVVYYDPSLKHDCVNLDNAATYINGLFWLKTVYSPRAEIVYRYLGGIWEATASRFLQAECEKMLKRNATNNVVKEIVEKIKRLTATTSEEFEKEPEHLIPLENGALDISRPDKIILQFHSPNNNFKVKLPVRYDPKATCPNTLKFINEVFYETDIPQVQEWGGFQLLKRYLLKKAVIIVGPRDTGKTIYQKLQVHFFGEKNVSGLSLQDIGGGKKFDLLSLKNKYLNAYDDLSSRDLSDQGAFKVATGGGFIRGEAKFGDICMFKSYAKLLFCCNQIPAVKDIDDEAYYSRWLVWFLDNQIPKEQQDLLLLDKMTTQQELSGLLNWYLEGLARLLKNGKFTNEKDPSEVKTIMMRSGNPLAQFVQDCLIREDGSRIDKDKMFEYYTSYVTKKGLARLSKEQLGRQLGLYATYIIAKQDSKRFWENVRLNPNCNELLDTLDTFKKNTSKVLESENNIDIIFSKVSNPSKSLDTLDTSYKKDNCDYCRNKLAAEGSKFCIDCQKLSDWSNNWKSEDIVEVDGP